MSTNRIDSISAAKLFSTTKIRFEASTRTSVALLGFANLGGKENDAWLPMALSEMCATEQ